MRRIAVSLTLIIFIALLMGLIGGIIGNLWGQEFSVGRDDKFDIFASLLVSLLTVLGLAFGGIGLAAYSRLTSELRTQAQAAVRKQAEESARGVESRLVEIQDYLGRLHYEMAMIAADKGFETLADAYFSQATQLLVRALDTAEASLPGYSDIEHEASLVLRIKNNLAMTYARIKDPKHKRRAHQLAAEVLPWGNGTRDRVWEYWETSCFVRHELPRDATNDKDRSRLGNPGVIGGIQGRTRFGASGKPQGPLRPQGQP